jgi:hypothetical protein
MVKRGRRIRPASDREVHSALLSSQWP